MENTAATIAQVTFGIERYIVITDWLVLLVWFENSHTITYDSDMHGNMDVKINPVIQKRVRQKATCG